MARLIGIVNPKVDKADYFNYWLWRPNPPIPCEAERLNIEKMDVDGNVQYRIIGPHSDRCPDGVYAKIQFNPALNPTPYYGEPANEDSPPPDPNPGGKVESIDPSAPVVPEQDIQQSAPANNINVSAPDRLPGETNSQLIRRKAIAKRWEAAKLEELAQQMEALEAQGLI